MLNEIKMADLFLSSLCSRRYSQVESKLSMSGVQSFISPPYLWTSLDPIKVEKIICYFRRTEPEYQIICSYQIDFSVVIISTENCIRRSKIIHCALPLKKFINK